MPYKKYGLEVYESGINIVVNISRLEAKISYNGLSFSIRLPYKLFGNNTKGQCGTCTNNTADDCILPSGKIISDCEIAADEWLVNDPSKPHCPHKGLTTKLRPPRHQGFRLITALCLLSATSSWTAYSPSATPSCLPSTTMKLACLIAAMCLALIWSVPVYRPMPPSVPRKVSALTGGTTPRESAL